VSTVTPINQFQIPQLADSPNIETAIQPFANAIDQFILPRFTTVAVRDTRISAPTEGMMCYVSGTKETYRYNGTTWVSAVPRVAYKPSNQNATGTTLVADSAMLLSVETNSKYVGRINLLYFCQHSNDFKINCIGPPSCSVSVGSIALEAGATTARDLITNMEYNSETNSIVAGAPAVTAAPSYALLHLFGQVGANTGVIGFYFAKYAAAGSDSICLAGSFMELWKVG